MSEVIETPLSTIVQPIEEMTLAAVEMLEKNMNGEKIKEYRLDIIFNKNMVKRTRYK